MSAHQSDMMALMNEPATLQEALTMAYAYRDMVLAERMRAARRCAQLEVELATARERWARLEAEAQDAQRQGYTVDVLSFMRGIEREVPSAPVGS